MATYTITTDPTQDAVLRDWLTEINAERADADQPPTDSDELLAGYVRGIISNRASLVRSRQAESFAPFAAALADATPEDRAAVARTLKIELPAEESPDEAKG